LEEEKQKVEERRLHELKKEEEARLERERY
jgi:hypothetical protein